MRPKRRFAICVANPDDNIDLEVHKIYQIVPDPRSEKEDWIRVIDDSGEDYLYSKQMFVPIELPQTVTNLLSRRRRIHLRRRSANGKKKVSKRVA